MWHAVFVAKLNPNLCANTRRARYCAPYGPFITAHLPQTSFFLTGPKRQPGQVETINSMVALGKLRVPDQGGCDWFLVMDSD